MQIRSALLTCWQAASYSCATASPIVAGRFQELASLGGLSENEATNPAAKSLSELGDDSITHLRSGRRLGGGDITSSV